MNRQSRVSASTVTMLITQNDSPVPAHDQIFENTTQFSSEQFPPSRKRGAVLGFRQDATFSSSVPLAPAHTEAGVTPRYPPTCLRQPLPQAVFIFVNYVFPRTRHRSRLSRPIKIGASFASPAAWLPPPHLLANSRLERPSRSGNIARCLAPRQADDASPGRSLAS